MIEKFIDNTKKINILVLSFIIFKIQQIKFFYNISYINFIILGVIFIIFFKTHIKELKF